VCRDVGFGVFSAHGPMLCPHGADSKVYLCVHAEKVAQASLNRLLKEGEK